VLITGVLVYLLTVFGVLNERIIQAFKVLTFIILIACIMIGTVTSGLASRRMLKSPASSKVNKEMEVISK
jgi:multisubunit Na+/H+ antiporter MnhB subunit